MDVEGVRPDNNGSGVYNAAELSVLELADQIYALEKAREELLPKGFRDAMLGRAFSEALNAVPLIGGVNMVIEEVRGVESFSGIRLNSTERTLRGVAAGLELIAVIAPTVRSIVKNNAFRAVLTGGMPATPKEAKLLWTSFEHIPKVTLAGKEYAEVGGRLYTEHAVQRMLPSGLDSMGRSISPTYVDGILRTVKPTDIVVNGVTRQVYVSGSVQVVTENGIVVTVNPFRY